MNLNLKSTNYNIIIFKDLYIHFYFKNKLTIDQLISNGRGITEITNIFVFFFFNMVHSQSQMTDEYKL